MAESALATATEEPTTPAPATPTPATTTAPVTGPGPADLVAGELAAGH